MYELRAGWASQFGFQGRGIERLCHAQTAVKQDVVANIGRWSAMRIRTRRTPSRIGGGQYRRTAMFVNGSFCRKRGIVAAGRTTKMRHMGCLGVPAWLERSSIDQARNRWRSAPATKANSATHSVYSAHSWRLQANQGGTFCGSRLDYGGVWDCGVAPSWRWRCLAGRFVSSMPATSTWNGR